MLRWYPSALLRVVLELTYVPIAFFSIFVVMVLVEGDTPWAAGPWSGPGPTTDFWKLVAVLAIGWALLVFGWRGAKTVFKWLIVVWHAGLTAASILWVLRTEDLVVRGEAIGFRMSLGLLAPALSLTALVCALVWISGDRSESASIRTVSPLQRRNKLAAGLAVVVLILAGIAFALDYDEVGVLAAFAATFACHEAMRPLNPSAELHRALMGEGSAPRG